MVVHCPSDVSGFYTRISLLFDTRKVLLIVFFKEIKSKCDECTFLCSSVQRFMTAVVQKFYRTGSFTHVH